LGGGLNLSQLNSPELDEMLQRSRTETDPEKRQQALNEAQQWIVENAIIIPFYAPYTYKALSNQVQGARESAYMPMLELDSAYFVP
jgi:peptide/nickel transport system substrate-binding protein